MMMLWQNCPRWIAIWIDNGFDQAGSELGRVLSDTRRRLKAVLITFILFIHFVGHPTVTS